MSGTTQSCKKAVKTIKIRHGEDFYRRIGSKGGKNGHTGGFAANPELAKIAGAKGGKKSKRGPAIRLTADKIKKIREELSEAEQETLKMKIRLLNNELERLRNETTQ